MHSLESDGLRLEVDESSVRVVDRGRDCAWRAELPAGMRVVKRDDSIEVVADRIVHQWAVEGDHVSVKVRVQGDVARVGWVPRFVCLDGVVEPVVPQYQGALLRGGGENWSAEGVRGGHTNLAMGMLALSGRRGGLLLVPDRMVGWVGKWGNDERGPWVAFDAVPVETESWREVTARIYPCDRGVFGIAMRYRKLMQERKQWVSWDEKIAAKPSLDRLFGSLMTFIGYVQDETVDYVASIRRLREMGFDSLMVYPARFAHYTDLTMAGGRPPVMLTDAQIAAMQREGALISPWSWMWEGKDDGSNAMRSIFRHGPTGPARGWAMDGQQWYHVCQPYQRKHIAERLAGDMGAMDWLHFDVNATHPACGCWSKDHDAHPGRPLSPLDAIAETNRMFSLETIGDRIISSEGFNDAFTQSYDIGSTKMVPLDGDNPRAVPIPLTMLVYHDCCMHDWWELHNYNENPCWTLGKSHTGNSALGRVGSGAPQLKAAVDALNGVAPNVFPFGTQYGWVTHPGGKTYPFQMRLDDASVQEALRAALPVTKLHRQIGKLAMTGFEFVAGSLLVQRTTFADGTEVVANLGGAAADTDDGELPPHSWRATRL